MTGRKNRYPVGLRLRRARKEAGFSQRELATKAGVSQAMVSYYERMMIEPNSNVLKKFSEILRISLDNEPIGETPQTESSNLVGLDLSGIYQYRSYLVQSLERLENLVYFDHTEHPISADIGFAIETTSHVLFVVIDGKEAGVAGSTGALLVAAAILGAVTIRKQGVVWPEELIPLAADISPYFGKNDALGALFVAVFDKHHRILYYGRSAFPPPWLKVGSSLMQLVGRKKGMWNFYTGEEQLEPDSLLAIATDGFAHRQTKSSRSLWDSTETKRLISKSKTPRQLMLEFSRRAKVSYGPDIVADDMFIVAVAL